MNNRQNLFFVSELKRLLQKYAYKTGKFTLASGKTSDYFIDCKQTILQAYGHFLVGEIFYSEIENINWRMAENNLILAVAGVELGGCPIASAISMASYHKINHWQPPLTAIYVRKDSKEHGSKRILEGNDLLPKDCNIVLVEDTVTTGASSLKAISKLKDAGYHIEYAICLVDRLEGGKELLKKENVDLESIFTIKDFQ